MNDESAPTNGDALGDLLPDGRTDGTRRLGKEDIGSLGPHHRATSDSQVPCGLDRIRVHVPIKEMPDTSGWYERTRRRAGSRSIRSLNWTTIDSGTTGTPISATVFRHPTLGPSASLQFNPARLVDANGFAPLDFEHLPTALDIVENAVQGDGRVVLRDSLRAARVTEWDYAFDTISASPQAHIQAAAHRTVPYAAQQHTYWKAGVPTGTVISNTQWSVSVYDKALRNPGTAPDGLLRIEVRSKDGYCRSKGLDRVEALSAEGLREAALDRVRHCGLDRPVHLSQAESLHILIAEHGWDGTKRRGLLGHLLARAAGIPDDPSRNLRAEYEGFITAHGLLWDPPPLQVPGVVARLDFDHHAEVIAA